MRLRVGAFRLFASTPGTFAPPPWSDITHLVRSPTLRHSSAIRAIAWQWMTSGLHSRSALPRPGTKGLPPLRSSSATSDFGIGHQGYMGLNRRMSSPSTVSRSLPHSAVVAKSRTSCPAALCAFARFQTTCSVPPQSSNESRLSTCAILIAAPSTRASSSACLS